MIFLNTCSRGTLLNLKNTLHHNKKWHHTLQYTKSYTLKSKKHAKLPQQRMTSSKSKQSTIEWWLSAKEIPPRYTPKWYIEMLLICTVFGITGSSTMILVRPAVSNILGLQGSFKDGPWSYRICSLVIMTPVYATLLG